MVALFNAIAKAKRDALPAEEPAKDKIAPASTGTSVASSSNNCSSARAKVENKDNGNKKNKQMKFASSETGADSKNSSKEPVGAGAGAGGATWAALRDDYMIGSTLSVKVMHFKTLPNMLLNVNSSFYVVNCVINLHRIGTRPLTRTVIRGCIFF